MNNKLVLVLNRVGTACFLVVSGLSAFAGDWHSAWAWTVPALLSLLAHIYIIQYQDLEKRHEKTVSDLGAFMRQNRELRHELEKTVPPVVSENGFSISYAEKPE